jgi:hypothetical protein
MGYLNNTTRVLDAILTKKGREILSSGGSGGLGSFEVTKFALGDDEIDYGLWDTTHAQGSRYYGAVLDNLPALEPFNDPSEIMKYKLVTRSEDTQAMAKLRDRGPSGQPAYFQPQLASGSASGVGQFETTGLFWYATALAGSNTNRVRVLDFSDAIHASTITTVGRGKRFGIQHLDNSGYGATDYADYQNEGFTITVLDSSVAFLAPSEQQIPLSSDHSYPFFIQSGDLANQLLWKPYVNSVQHVSQTIRNCQVMEGLFQKRVYTPNEDPNLPGSWMAGQWTSVTNKGVAIYPKRIAENNSPAKTTILITGEISGATFEYDVTVTYSLGTESSEPEGSENES